MKIIVGLGNPGERYAKTRHNVGFLIVDQLAQRWGAASTRARFGGQILATRLRNELVLLVKPQTFMNNSGECVAPLIRAEQVQVSDLIVVHDEVDLDPQVVRIKNGGGSGGHRGVQSISAQLQDVAYARLRYGIGHPRKILPMTAVSVADYVLHAFSAAELRALDARMDALELALDHLIQGDFARAANAVGLNPAGD